MAIAWPLPKRQHHIEELKNKGTAVGGYPLYFQNRVQDLPIYLIPVEMPCYRLANSRTRDLQAEYIAKHSLPADYFLKDPDSEVTLEIQEEFLKRMVNDRDLLSVLRKEEQSDPLVLDINGYVVNGNRRLCAMHMLLDEDKNKYMRFGHVRVVILPQCDIQDIRELEVMLQVRPDTRAEYTWVAIALTQRELLGGGMPDDRIAQLYDMKVKDLQQNLRMLETAEAYLTERGWAGQYSRVAKHKEYAFQKLLKHRERCGGEQERDAFTQISYLLVDDPTGGRLYDRIPNVEQNLNEVVTNLRQELPTSTDTDTHDSNIPSADDELFGAPQIAERQYEGIATVLRDPGARDQARSIVQDTLETIDRRERERKDSEYCLRMVSQAHTSLTNAANALDETANKTGMEEQLANIEILVARIRKWLRNENHC